MATQIENSLFNKIKKAYMNGPFNQTKLAVKLNICRNTLLKYTKELREIERLYPKKLGDPNFRIVKVKKVTPKTYMYGELLSALPMLIANYNHQTVKIQLVPLHNDYKLIYPNGYSLTCFTNYFIAWRRENNICLYTHRSVKWVSDEDKVELIKWRTSQNHSNWERSMVILDAVKGRPLIDISLQLNRAVKTILRWIKNYNLLGIAGLTDKPREQNQQVLDSVKIKQENIIKLVHQSPTTYGINRTSWRLIDLKLAYEKVYHVRTCCTTIGTHLSRMGYGFRKSRQVLTSPDPLYKEKLNNIKHILSRLKHDEKFFSVDEYGHFAVKLKGGRTFVKADDIKIIPQLQKSKGFMVVTAALELSTNQVTHFYSRSKDTDEMIKLISLLITQYATQSKIYISWDAATWHRSKKLKEWIASINANDDRKVNATPLVELVPLPSSAQFLNVIESIFSGLARAVIHNSDYERLEDCQSAIDTHFKERNEYFLLHPKKAGNKIWGKETVKPVFNEANNCKGKNGRL